MRWPREHFCPALVILLVIAGAASAQVELPLNGYFRAGKLMPVKVPVKNSPQRLMADGAITTDLSAGAGGLVPMLILIDSAGPVKFDGTEVPVRPLLPNQRLIGVPTTNADIPDLASVFPGQTIVPVILPDLPLLPGPASAWEALDAVVFDAPPPNGRVGELASAGITVIVRSSNRPDEAWPWRQMGNKWILQADPAGPTRSIDPLAYLPLDQWQGAKTAAQRMQIFFAGVIIVLLLLSTLLLRGYKSYIAAAGMTIFLAASLQAWRISQPSVNSAGGAIIVHSPGVRQVDNWLYLSANSSGTDTLASPWRPIAASIEHARALDLRLECYPKGAMQWRYKLPPRAKLALLDRIIEPSAPFHPPQETIISPLYDFARQAYLSPGAKILGQEPRDAWPAIIILRE